MSEQRFWGMKRLSASAMIVRGGVALAAIASSLVLAWMLMSHAGFAHAAAQVTPTPTATAPTTPAGPVNKVWYFAEGRVGKSFREYLTIDNPSATACAVNIGYDYQLDNATTAGNKIVAVNVPANSRVTESVNNDLGIADTATVGASLASVVAVNATSTPNCNGVVVERPEYFTNFSGIASGTDVIGSTKLGTNFYFADVPEGTISGAKFASFITILNPNNTQANLKFTFAQSGTATTQTLSVPANARGTFVGQYSGHMPMAVTSSQPVMIERPTYFSNVNGINGAYDVVGTPTLANDWLFAEGYTGSSTQEYLTIANIQTTGTAAANVTIILKSAKGATNSYPVTVNANTQTIFNVNTNNTFTGSTPEVSAEVKSTGANIIVQREMYFTYKHTLSNTAIGGTDVIGQVGPAAHSSYSFSEGYSNTGYNEWLTIQNPTTTTETIYLTLVNGDGKIFTENFAVTANSRFTLDITATVHTAFNAGTSSTANSASMTVQTLNGAVFVAERPMYWNTTGVSPFVTQGGTDVIGYIGG